MGGEYWEYYTPFRGDVATTLGALRQQEFQAGRYNGNDLRPTTISQAIADADADGTRSILDMERLSDAPEPGAASPVPREELVAIFGTDRPTRAMVEQASQGLADESLDDIIEEIGRGEGRYIVIYHDDEPAEVFFCGYSYD